MNEEMDDSKWLCVCVPDWRIEQFTADKVAIMDYEKELARIDNEIQV